MTDRDHQDSDVLGKYLGAPAAPVRVDDLPRCDCGHLFEICNHPNCHSAAPVQGEEVKAGEHTPTPWHVASGFIRDAEGGILCVVPHNPENGKNWEADFAFIVTAVNSHHAMIAENRACYQRIDELEIELSNDKPVEVWRGDRKVTVYRDRVLRVWGTNIDTEMSDEPRSLDTVQSAFEWLFTEILEPFPAESGAHSA